MCEDALKKLTVIIPFLNEGIEVARTVASVRQYAADQVEILVINDASNYLYDYEEMLTPYSVTYIRNEERLGIAACRDLGVRLMQTPYFLFLDAHMRFYREGWAQQIAGYLDEDDRRLLCCQTYALVKDESDEVVPLSGRGVSYGSYISFRDADMLSPKWIFTEDPQPESEVIDIPCVFGAAYAASKRYWTYLRGLEGLIRYGFDETYISLKVWMEGGRCQLILILCTMKASHYNIYTKNKNNVVCYNTKCDSFCLLSHSDADLLKNDLPKLSEHSPKAYDDLVKNRFIIEDDVDEFQELCREYEASINSPYVYHLTLLPSLDCNLRCWYCFEKHVSGSHLTAEKSQAILEHVKQLFENQPDLNSLRVELFGGEPLLYFKEELYPLLSQIKQYVVAQQKHVSFFFVTNAVCITPDTLPLFDELNASFQISIDGYKDRHDQIKFMPETKEGTYDNMIRTIYVLTEQLSNTYINLRINYDDDTLPYMKDLIKDLIDVDRRKMGVHLERVWQTGTFMNYDNEELKSVINLWMLNGFKVSYMNMGRRSYSCKASARNQCVISYDGAVYKCSGRDFTAEHQNGVLLPDGHIQWNQQKLDKRLSIVTYDNEMCRACKFLPLCWGPCCQKQLETTPDDFRRFCQKQNMELNIADYIRYRFNNAYISTKLTR